MRSAAASLRAHRSSIGHSHVAAASDVVRWPPGAQHVWCARPQTEFTRKALWFAALSGQRFILVQSFTVAVVAARALVSVTMLRRWTTAFLGSLGPGWYLWSFFSTRACGSVLNPRLHRTEGAFSGNVSSLARGGKAEAEVDGSRAATCYAG